MKTNIIYFWIIIPLLFLAVSCESTNNVSGDNIQGEILFKEATLGDGPGCSTCHLLEDDAIKIGPSLKGVAIRAQSRITDMTAEEYLSQSILAPNDYIVRGFPASVMYQEFSEQLSDQEVADLVAFLMTLE